MLKPQAKAAAATEEPDGRSVSELVLDGRRWCCVAGTSGHRGPFRQETGFLVPLGAVRRVPQGYSPYETQVDGLPIWGMSGKMSQDALHRGHAKQRDKPLSRTRPAIMSASRADPGENHEQADQDREAASRYEAVWRCGRGLGWPRRYGPRWPPRDGRPERRRARRL